MMTCDRCAGLGYIETCRADGEDCRRETCPVCQAWEAPQDDDGGPAHERAVDEFRERRESEDL